MVTSKVLAWEIARQATGQERSSSIRQSTPQNVPFLFHSL